MDSQHLETNVATSSSDAATVQTEVAVTTKASRRYHHGDLAAALIDQALIVARDGGADAIVLRELTRQVGVSPRAAYRHFADRDQLVVIAATHALRHLACCIEDHQDRVGDEQASDHQTIGLHQLRAVGTGYIDFAVREPGWFDLGFFALRDMTKSEAPESAGTRGRTPFQLLTDALEACAAAGLIEPSEIGDAAVSCWSTVHGYALLATRGPLSFLGADEANAAGLNVVNTIMRGVLRPSSTLR